MNILFCSVGRWGELIKDFRKSASEGTKIVAAQVRTSHVFGG